MDLHEEGEFVDLKWILITMMILSQGWGEGFFGKSYAQDKVLVHLFEWKWKDVAKECEDFLGPNHYDGVQISPPHEHIINDFWWARYQVVSYKLHSRGGSEAEFIDMVHRCKQAGVNIYADVVINHMTSGRGHGWAGTPYEKWKYDVYERQDFHVSCSIEDYHDRWQVQFCDLKGLADLATETAYVQEQIADYLQKMMDIGVAGFRIDAAKHIPSDDIENILKRLHTRPYIYQEVIDLGGEPIQGHEYYKNGRVTDFKYGAEMARIFFGDYLLWFDHFEGTSRGLIPSENSIIFLDNHDNQRGHGGRGRVLTHKDNRLYALAHVLMMGLPHADVKVMSSYDFNDSDQGPPSIPVHELGKVNCFKQWKCEHRWELIAKMAKFRKEMSGLGTQKWWNNGKNRLAFARGKKGFVVINKEREFFDSWLDTGLPQGRYCNLSKGGIQEGKGTCVKESEIIEVNKEGWANFKIPGEDAAVISINEMVP